MSTVATGLGGSGAVSVQDAVESTRRLDVQGLRGVAVLLVVLFHAGLPLQGGFIGVDVFFVVSGFVITRMLWREKSTTGQISLANFYARRARRLIPAAATVTCATLLIWTFLVSPVGSSQTATGRAAAAATLFSANGFFFLSTGGYFQPDATMNPFLHTWSLSVEEQFYVFFPSFFLLCMCRASPAKARRRTAALFAVVGALSLVLSLICSHHALLDLVHLDAHTSAGEANRFAFFATPLRAWEFVAGALVLLLGRSPSRRQARFWVATGALLVLASAFLIPQASEFPGAYAVAPVAGTAALLWGGGDASSRVTQLLSSSPLVWLGDRSYSWYLWHWPMLVLSGYWFPENTAARTAAVVVSLALAALAFACVERPIHERRRLAGRHSLAVICTLGVALPLVISVSLSQASSEGWGESRIRALRADVVPNHADLLRGCASVAPLTSPANPSCVWSVPESQGTILLIGDSNAGHLTEPVVEAARHSHFDLEVATSGGCPLLLRHRYPDDSCHEFVVGSLRTVRRMATPYAAIIISNASVGYLDSPQAAWFDDEGLGDPITGWSLDMRRTVRATGERSPVIVVGAVPQFPGLPDCVAPTIWRDRSSGCGEMSSRSQAFRFRQRLIETEKAALPSGSATYFDTGRLLCNHSAGCSAFRNAQLVYRDGQHLSVSGSKMFARPMQRLLNVTIPALRSRHGDIP